VSSGEAVGEGLERRRRGKKQKTLESLKGMEHTTVYDTIKEQMKTNLAASITLSAAIKSIY
jgi:hypothetical protein